MISMACDFHFSENGKELIYSCGQKSSVVKVNGESLLIGNRRPTAKEKETYMKFLERRNKLKAELSLQKDRFNCY